MSVDRQQLFSNPLFTHRICGMHKNMAVKVRDNLKLHRAKSPDTNFQALDDSLRAFLHAKYPSLAMGSAFGGAVGPLSFSSFNDAQVNGLNVLVLWLSDVTDIDSKMMTFVRNDTPHGVFQHLYKIDLQ